MVPNLISQDSKPLLNQMLYKESIPGLATDDIPLIT